MLAPVARYDRVAIDACGDQLARAIAVEVKRRDAAATGRQCAHHPWPATARDDDVQRAVALPQCQVTRAIAVEVAEHGLHRWQVDAGGEHALQARDIGVEAEGVTHQDQRAVELTINDTFADHRGGAVEHARSNRQHARDDERLLDHLTGHRMHAGRAELDLLRVPALSGRRLAGVGDGLNQESEKEQAQHVQHRSRCSPRCTSTNAVPASDGAACRRAR
jgi:hypothetical protein